MAGSLGRARDWPLVGRGDELDRLRIALRRLEIGGVVLAGEAGVGKTRVAREALALAEQEGIATARAVATRAGSTIPLGALAALVPVADSRPERRVDLVHRAVDGISAAAEGRPLVVQVDDAHLLDDTSALVLLHLATTRTAFVLATVRTGEPAPDAITGLWREGIAERIEIDPLDRADVDRLITSVLGNAVDGPTLRQLWDASRGNPLVLRELLLGALDVGLLRDDGGLWRLTEAVQVSPALAELIEARLADASPEERAALELLAVGEPLGLATLAAMTSADAVDGAERRGLLTVMAEGRRRVVRLAHPTHGDVLRRGMPALRTMTVNRLLANAVEATGARRREDALRLAVWRLEGGGEIQPDLMLDAAHRAFFARDDVLAERLARSALDAGAGIEAALTLAEVLSGVGRHEEAEALLAGFGAAAQTDEQRAMVAMRRAETLYWGLDREDDARAVLVAAENNTDDRSWREELVGVRATYELLGGRPLAAVSLVEPLLTRSEGRAFVEAATAAAPALAVMGRTEDAVAVADQALTAHLALGDQLVLSEPGIHVVSRVFALAEAGYVSEAATNAAAGYDAAVGTNQIEGHAWFALMLGRVALLQGLLDEASRRFLESTAAFADLEQPGPRRWCQAGLVLAAAQSGDAPAATKALDLLDAMGHTPMLMMEPDVERARAWHALVEGDTAGAQRLFEDAAQRARESGAHALEASALHDLARVGAAESAAERLAELAGVVDGDLTGARAAHAVALATDDASALDRVSDTFEGLGTLLFAAEAAAAAAASHRNARDARTAERSAQRSAALRKRIDGAATPALDLAGPAGVLTPREREVAKLAAGGRANADIAADLVVSVRTVESHLQRAYEKLGVSSRAELGEALADHEVP